MRPELLTVIYGCMFAEKTKRLIEHHRPDGTTVAFKPDIDADRYQSGAMLASKDPKFPRVPAILVPVDNVSVIWQEVARMDEVTRVLIDEANFFPTKEFIELIELLTSRSIEVVVAGLTHFASKEPWGPLPELLKIPGVQVKHVFAECDGKGRKCPKPAIWSYQKFPHDKVLVDGESAYGATCDEHYSVLHQGERYDE